jgi:hypothetical protein
MLATSPERRVTEKGDVWPGLEPWPLAWHAAALTVQPSTMTCPFTYLDNQLQSVKYSAADVTFVLNVLIYFVGRL